MLVSAVVLEGIGPSYLVVKAIETHIVPETVGGNHDSIIFDHFV